MAGVSSVKPRGEVPRRVEVAPKPESAKKDNGAGKAVSTDNYTEFDLNEGILLRFPPFASQGKKKDRDNPRPYYGIGAEIKNSF